MNLSGFSVLSKGIVGAGLLVLATTQPSAGYIDPGTGSILLQILAAVGAAFLFLFNWMSTKIRNLFSFGRGDKKTTRRSRD